MITLTINQTTCFNQQRAAALNTRTADSWSYKYYKYDVRGRVIKMWNIISGFDTLITDYNYNSQDQMIYYSHSGLEDVKSFRNLYDDAGRLHSVEMYNTVPDDPNPYYTILTEYSYNKNSQVDEQELNEGNVKNEYYYNKRNWITQAQHSSGLFDYTNEYFKNGNVKSQTLSGSYNDSFSNNANLNFSYTYDYSNRLLQSQMTSSYKLINTYDKDGNILTLKRYGSTTNRLDSFNYTYYTGTNKLKNVMHTRGDYAYDYNGNMIKDYINDNTEIIYEYRNLISQLNHHTGTTVDTMFVTKYYYDEAGNRIRKMLYKYIGSIFDMPPEGSGEETDISDPENWQLLRDEVYSRDMSGREVAIYVNDAIEEYPLYGLDLIGKLKNDVPYYYYKDHLGSVRAVVNSSNQLVSAQDYDQWGYILQNRSFASGKSKFKFTEKERDAESSYDYFGARYYDSRIGRWGSVDKLQDTYVSFNPYNYTLCNPLTLIDSKGLDVELPDDEKKRGKVLNIIKMGLPSEFEKYINYIYVNDTYLIDQELINTAPIISGSEEFNALLDLVNNEEVTKIDLVETGSSISRLTSTGEMEKFIFQKYHGGLTIMSGNVPNTNTYPNAPKSLSSNTEIYINSSFNLEGQVKYTAHELYGHAHPYVRGERWEHYFLDDDFDKKVSRIMENAVKNFNNR